MPGNGMHEREVEQSFMGLGTQKFRAGCLGRAIFSARPKPRQGGDTLLPEP